MIRHRVLASLVLLGTIASCSQPGPMLRRAPGGRDSGAAPENPQRAAEARRLHRLDEDGHYAADALLAAKQVSDAMPMQARPGAVPGAGIGTQDAGISSWTWLGPANVGGRARGFVIDPTDPGRMFLGAANGGIWRSLNGGASWEPLNDFLPSLAVQALAMDPIDTDILYAGTGQGYGTANGVPGAGIFRTTDGGDTWVQIPSTAPPPGGGDPTNDAIYPWNYTYAISVNPDLPARVLAAVASGIHRSTNRATTWTQVYSTDTDLDGFADHRVTDVKSSGSSRAIAGLDTGQILYSDDSGITWSQAAMPASLYGAIVNVVYGANSSVIIVSDTKGFAKGDTIAVGSSNPDLATVTEIVSNTVMSITPVPNGHAFGTLVSLLPGGRVSLAWGTGGVAYASMNAGCGAILKSTDNGETWSRLAATSATADYLCPISSGVTDPNRSLGWHVNAIWVAPNDNDFIVVGGIDLWRDLDVSDGLDLGRISNWLTYHHGLSAHADHHVILAHPDYNGTTNKAVYVANDGGVQLASDIKDLFLGDLGWTNLANNLGITQFYAGAASPSGSFMLGGAQDNGMLQLDAVGDPDGWTQCTNCTGDGGPSAIDPRSPNSVFYQTTQNLNVVKSVTGGLVYFPATNGLLDAGSEDVSFIAPFMMDPNDPDILLAGGLSIWRSVDGADFWMAIRPPRPGGSPSTALAIAEGDSNNIWVGYRNGALSRTNNSVALWIDIDDNGFGSSPLPNTVVTDIAISPQDNRDVFVSVGGYALNRLWYTNDSGATWQSRHSNLPPVQINTIAIHPDNPNWVYVGTDLGVYASEDRGVTWNRTPSTGNHDGPVNTEVADLFWHGDYLVAATFGRGMYRTHPFVTVFVDENNTGFADGSQASPFRIVMTAVGTAGPGTTISIAPGDYDESGPVVFSMRGQVIAPLGGVTIH